MEYQKQKFRKEKEQKADQPNKDARGQAANEKEEVQKQPQRQPQHK